MSSGPGAAAAVLAGRGQQAEERADPLSFLRGVPEQAVVVDGVPNAPPGAGAGEVTSGLQVGHDRLDGAFGQSTAALMSRIRAPGSRPISTSTRPCPVSSVQLPPLSSESLMPSDCITHERKHARFFAYFY